MRSIGGRAAREVAWRQAHKAAIITVGRFAGIDPLIVGSALSKRIEGGRLPVFVGGHHVGYASATDQETTRPLDGEAAYRYARWRLGFFLYWRCRTEDALRNWLSR